MNDLLIGFAYLTGIIAPVDLPLGTKPAYYIVEVDGQRMNLADPGQKWKLILHAGTAGTIRLANADGTAMNPGVEVGEIAFGVETKPIPLAVRYDYDGNGMVGFSDIKGLAEAWGRCSKDMEEVPCK